MAQGGRTVGGGPRQMDLGNMNQMLQFMMQYRQAQAGQQWEIMKSQAEDWIGPSGAGPSAFFRDNQAALKRQLSLTFGGGIGGRKRADQVFDQLLQGEMDFDQLARLNRTAVARNWLAAEEGEAPASETKQGEQAPAQTASEKTVEQPPEGEKTVTREVVTGYEYPQPGEVPVMTKEFGTPTEGGAEGGVEGALPSYASGAVSGVEGGTKFPAVPGHGTWPDSEVARAIAGKTQGLNVYVPPMTEIKSRFERSVGRRITEQEESRFYAQAGGWDKPVPTKMSPDEYKKRKLSELGLTTGTIEEVQAEIMKAEEAGDDERVRLLLREGDLSYIRMSAEAAAQYDRDKAAYNLAVRRGKKIIPATAEEAGPPRRGETPAPVGRAKEVTVPEYEGPYGEFLVQNKQAQTRTVTETVPARQAPLAPNAEADPESLKEVVEENTSLSSGIRGKIEQFIQDAFETGGNLTSGQQQVVGKAAKEIVWKATGEGPLRPEVMKDAVYFMDFLQEHSGAKSVAENPVVADILYSAAKNADRTLTIQENQNRINMIEAAVNFADYLRKTDPNSPEYKLQQENIRMALRLLGIKEELAYIDLDRAKVGLRLAEIQLERMVNGGEEIPGVTKEQVDLYKRDRDYFDKNPIDQRLLREGRENAFNRWKTRNPEIAARWERMQIIQALMFEGMAGLVSSDEGDLSEEQQALESDFSF